MTEKIHTPVLQVLESGVQITMTVSRSFQERLEQGGYVYICLPWVNREWHAFSLFEVPDHDNQRQVFIQNVGNWTVSSLFFMHCKENHLILLLNRSNRTSFINILSGIHTDRFGSKDHSLHPFTMLITMIIKF